MPAPPSVIQTPKCCHSFTRELQRACGLNLRGRSQPSEGLFLHISRCTKRSNLVSLAGLSQHSTRGGCEGGAAFPQARWLWDFSGCSPGSLLTHQAAEAHGGPARSSGDQLHTRTGVTGACHRAPKGSWREEAHKPPRAQPAAGQTSCKPPAAQSPLPLSCQERPADTERLRGERRLRPPQDPLRGLGARRYRGCPRPCPGTPGRTTKPWKTLSREAEPGRAAPGALLGRREGRSQTATSRCGR